VPSLNLVRWGGLAALLAGTAWVLASPTGIIAWGALGEYVAIMVTSREEAFGTPSFYLVKVVSTIALIGTLGGLVGLHTRQETSYGWLGLSGFFLAFVGTSLVMASTTIVIGSGRQFITTTSAPGLLGMFIGFTLLGVATLRARVLPRWCGLALIVCLPLAFVVLVILELIIGGVTEGEIAVGIALGATLGIIWLALGYMLCSESGAAAEQTPRVA
jgi:hypothetical protein